MAIQLVRKAIQRLLFDGQLILFHFRPVARNFSKLRMYSTAHRRVSTLLSFFFLLLLLAGGDEEEEEEEDEDSGSEQ